MTDTQLYLAIGIPVLMNGLFFGLLQWGLSGRFEGIAAKFTSVEGRLDEIVARLDRIEAKLENHTERIVRLEARTSPIQPVGRG